jgi:hypothetical protein
LGSACPVPLVRPITPSENNISTKKQIEVKEEENKEEKEKTKKQNKNKEKRVYLA